MRVIAATALALLPLAAASATPTRTAAQTNAAHPAKCDRFARGFQASVLRHPTPRAQRLDQLPPGDLHLTVERQVNGCHQPVIVRENIGGATFGGR
jgi:hypothetical protein